MPTHPCCIGTPTRVFSAASAPGLGPIVISSFCHSHSGTAGVQLLKIESVGTVAEKALLADVKSKSPDATAIELLPSSTCVADGCSLWARRICAVYCVLRVA